MRTRTSYTLNAFLLLSAVSLAGCVTDFNEGSDAELSDKKGRHKGDKPKKKSIQLDTGINMTYYELGNRHSNNVVILMHCYTDTNRSFMETAKELAREDSGLRIYVLDMRGHGETTMPSAASCAAAPEQCFEPSDMADDVFNFMYKKGIWKAHLVGHSMGSFVAQDMALRKPWQVKSITLVGSAASLVGNPGLEGVVFGLLEGFWRPVLEAQDPSFNWPEDAYLLTALDVDPDAEQFLRENWAVDPTADPTFLDEITVDTLDIPLGTWLGAAVALLSTDNRQRLQNIRVPVLVLWGIQDGFVLEDPEQQELRAALDVAVDNCKSEYFFKTYGAQPLPESGFQESDIGHAVQWAAPNTVARDIASFIDDGEPTNDLAFADPNDVSNILVEEDAANVIERRRPWYCW